MTLSLICTGLGMFYIGTPLMIIGAVLLMAAQGFALIVFFYTLGFLGAMVLPGMLLAHAAGVIITLVYFTRKPIDPNGEQKRERQFAVPWKAAIRAAVGLGLFSGIIFYAFESGTAPFTKTASEKDKAQEVVLTYLEQKYSERFEIKKVDYTWASGTYTMIVSPLGNPGLEFKVKADDSEPATVEADYYLNSLWSSQLNQKLAVTAEELYPGNSAFVKTYVYKNREAQGGVVKQYDSLMNRAGGALIHSQKVKMIVFADLDSEENLRTEKERIWELIRRMRDAMVPSDIDLDLEYYPKTLQTPENVAEIREDFNGFGRDADKVAPSHRSHVFNIGEIRSAEEIKIEALERRAD